MSSAQTPTRTRSHDLRDLIEHQAPVVALAVMATSFALTLIVGIALLAPGAFAEETTGVTGTDAFEDGESGSVNVTYEVIDDEVTELEVQTETVTVEAEGDGPAKGSSGGSAGSSGGGSSGGASGGSGTMAQTGESLLAGFLIAAGVISFSIPVISSISSMRHAHQRKEGRCEHA